MVGMHMKKILLVLALGLSTACTSIQSVSLTPIPANRKDVVQAEASKVIILGFNFNNDFVDGLVTDLERQCPNGKVSGILTKDEVINYFLFFVHKRRVSAQGFCQRSAAKVGMLSPVGMNAGVTR
jgi:hypothetical protein